MRVVTAAVVVLLVAACGTQSAQGPVTSAPRTAGPPPTDSVQPPTPRAARFTSQLNCAKPVTATHGLALYEYAGASVLGILDVSDPLKPTLLCWLSGANGGRFDQAPNEIVFWIGDRLGAADLTSGKVVQTDTLPNTPTEGSFSSDRTDLAYRTSDASAAGISLHLYRRGDRRDITP